MKHEIVITPCLGRKYPGFSCPLTPPRFDIQQVPDFFVNQQFPKLRLTTCVHIYIANRQPPDFSGPLTPQIQSCRLFPFWSSGKEKIHDICSPGIHNPFMLLLAFVQTINVNTISFDNKSMDDTAV